MVVYRYKNKITNMDNYRSKIFIRHGLKSDNLILWVAEKSNCTVVTHMFFKHINLLDAVLKHSKWIHDYRFDVYVEKHMVTLYDLQNTNHIKIKFIRCPYDRAISSYIMYRQKIDLNATFIDFLNYLLRNGAKRYASKINPHYQGQYFYLENTFKWDEIIKVENLDTEIDRVNKKYSLNLDCNYTSPHWRKNKTIKPSNIFIGDKTDISVSNVNYIDFYNDETRKLVEQIYVDDFNNSDYTFESFVEYNSKQ